MLAFKGIGVRRQVASMTRKKVDETRIILNDVICSRLELDKLTVWNLQSSFLCSVKVRRLVMDPSTKFNSWLWNGIDNRSREETTWTILTSMFFFQMRYWATSSPFFLHQTWKQLSWSASSGQRLVKRQNCGLGSISKCVKTAWNPCRSEYSVQEWRRWILWESRPAKHLCPSISWLQ